MKVLSKFTGRTYKGEIDYRLEEKEDTTLGKVLIAKKVLVTYRDVNSIKRLKELFREDYQVGEGIDKAKKTAYDQRCGYR